MRSPEASSSGSVEGLGRSLLSGCFGALTEGVWLEEVLQGFVSGFYEITLSGSGTFRLGLQSLGPLEGYAFSV